MSGLTLLSWICHSYPYQDVLTHLKYQGLAFYFHGMALAQDPGALPGIHFEPWQNGAICRPIWRHFQLWGQNDMAPAPPPHDLASILDDVLTVYGLLDADRLRRQVLLEEPHRAAWQTQALSIDIDVTRAHFHRMLNGPVHPPEHLFDRGSFSLDGAPVLLWPSFADLARCLRTGPAEVLTAESAPGRPGKGASRC